MIAQTVEHRRKLTFTIPGRLGAWRRAGRNTLTGITFTPAKMRSDEAMVRQLAALAMREMGSVRMEGPLRMLVQVWRQPPVSWSEKKRKRARYITSRPDFDNTLKLIADALNNIAYADDALIADGRLIKRYSTEIAECVCVDIEELGDQ